MSKTIGEKAEFLIDLDQRMLELKHFFKVFKNKNFIPENRSHLDNLKRSLFDTSKCFKYYENNKKIFTNNDKIKLLNHFDEIEKIELFLQKYIFPIIKN